MHDQKITYSVLFYFFRLGYFEKNYSFCDNSKLMKEFIMHYTGQVSYRLTDHYILQLQVIWELHKIEELSICAHDTHLNATIIYILMEKNTSFSWKRINNKNIILVCWSNKQIKITRQRGEWGKKEWHTNVSTKDFTNRPWLKRER